ncbi:MAG TPA: CaiB/BaiF CoA-transferase family protein [Gemmatimonadaceae bacterium]|nr:CaiB/BaiF CoA-transferase family protein [Gemmatimonadaceae bacterium]
MRPLDGITVLSLEHAVSAPFCTRQLADYGARVIKVERPGIGDFARGYDKSVNGLASYFVWLNRSKESLTLDLKQPEARAVIDALLPRIDVLVQNLGPGAATRLGYDFGTLSQAHPKLIVADISGYGDHGPFSDKKAYDLLIQAESALLSVTGTSDTPSRCGVSIADIAAGMYAYSGILMALLQRGRTGKGARVDVSMLEALAEWMSQPLYFGRYGGTAPSRTGASHPTIAPYGPHRTGDGSDVLLGIQNEREWAGFCSDVLGRPELARDERFGDNTQRTAHRAELTRIIEDSFSQMTAEQVVERLEGAAIANGRLNSIVGLADHPQLAARDRWRSVATSAGSIDALIPPANISGVDAMMGDVPAVGQHTDAILSELGYAPHAIAAMRATGAI